MGSRTTHFVFLVDMYVECVMLIVKFSQPYMHSGWAWVDYLSFLPRIPSAADAAVSLGNYQNCVKSGLQEYIYPPGPDRDVGYRWFQFCHAASSKVAATPSHVTPHFSNSYNLHGCICPGESCQKQGAKGTLLL